MKYIIFVIALMLVSACSSTPDKAESKDWIASQSGFLSDYSKLKKVDVNDGSDLMRYISEQVKGGKYAKVMFDPVSYYPAPKKTSNITKQVLSDISSYFNNTFAKTALANVEVVNRPGPDTLRIKMAITSVNVEDSSLAVYQYIPIAFVITAASGGLSEMNVKFRMEAEVVDSLTGEVLAAAVKTGEGETLDNDKEMVTLAHLKPLIDSWAVTMQETMTKSL